MGTRGAYGFRIDGIDKVTYNHSDSYPNGLGRSVTDFCANTKSVDLKPFARGIQLIEDNEKNYSRLRDTQGELTPYLEGLHEMIDNAVFLTDSLFCEWAYIINLDESVLEIYRGFNEEPGAAGRYADKADPEDVHASGYYGVKLIRTVPLADIENFNIDELETHS